MSSTRWWAKYFPGTWFWTKLFELNPFLAFLIEKNFGNPGGFWFFSIFSINIYIDLKTKHRVPLQEIKNAGQNHVPLHFFHEIKHFLDFFLIRSDYVRSKVSKNGSGVTWSILYHLQIKGRRKLVWNDTFPIIPWGSFWSVTLDVPSIVLLLYQHVLEPQPPTFSERNT